MRATPTISLYGTRTREVIAQKGLGIQGMASIPFSYLDVEASHPTYLDLRLTDIIDNHQAFDISLHSSAYLHPSRSDQSRILFNISPNLGSIRIGCLLPFLAKSRLSRNVRGIMPVRLCSWGAGISINIGCQPRRKVWGRLAILATWRFRQSRCWR